MYYTSCGSGNTHCSCNKDRRFAIAEVAKSLLTLALCSVAVYAVGRVACLVQEVFQ